MKTSTILQYEFLEYKYEISTIRPRRHRARGIGEQGIQRQAFTVQAAPVRQELYCPRSMSVQHSGTCSDPALSVAVLPQEATGGWLEQQGGEYNLCKASCFLYPG